MYDNSSKEHRNGRISSLNIKIGLYLEQIWRIVCSKVDPDIIDTRRFIETGDKFNNWGFKINGLGLDKDVIDKVYYKTLNHMQQAS